MGREHVRGVLRDRKGKEGERGLVPHVERAATRREQVEGTASVEERGESATCVGHLLEVVEYEEDSSIADPSGDGLQGFPALGFLHIEGVGHRVEEVIGPGDGGKGNEGRCVEVILHCVRDGDSQGGLPCSARARDGHEASGLEERGHRFDFLVAPDEAHWVPREGGGEGARARPRRGGRMGARRS